MIEFARPAALLLLLIVPLLAGWTGRARRDQLPMPRGGALAGEAGVAWVWTARLPTLLRGAVAALLVLALAGPRTRVGAAESREDGLPIVVAIDLSSSMLARDMGRGAERLAVARATTEAFIRARPRDPIGLVVFAGEAITQVPPTLEHAVLFSALRNQRIGLLDDGTAIGSGLATAVNRLRRVPAASRVVVLISDGANNRGEVPPLEAAAAAAALGVRVFTIGIGGDAAAAAPFRGRDGAEPTEIAAGLDEPLLREIAAMTGGRYARADTPEVLARIFERIDALVRSPVGVRRPPRYDTHHAWLIALAALLLGAEWALRSSRLGVLP